ncbi:hypothetical protein L6452_32340 [Arctium lappa]|uniref:Uncharacterized protein n=1 Tax=Arctium lappa TaxID=4217 RepID=A0ACB8Z578_ARCLA|nr:hypothetical protein L6452_32340 [Arctium lappa]
MSDSKHPQPPIISSGGLTGSTKAELPANTSQGRSEGYSSDINVPPLNSSGVPQKKINSAANGVGVGERNKRVSKFSSIDVMIDPDYDDIVPVKCSASENIKMSSCRPDSTTSSQNPRKLVPTKYYKQTDKK